MVGLFVFHRPTGERIAVTADQITRLREVGEDCYIYLRDSEEGIETHELFETLFEQWQEALGLPATPIVTSVRNP